ncbi:hypothetical protein [Streptomyces anulatus]|uniref:hypothetical protein n=1 Tax=Streptomyces anulatus TaxID=1892 RepID=UPI002254CEDE|nr:hypothetical protein [Streptomyces anulatus]MCX4521970.1 hypothetical protein [Streptomyces anulatus]MCX4604846.1 hypothetical protein [Streptomyces anulatus]WTE29669.1 hypothetical protein OHB50_30375 [Streptomyces anulatus]
MQGANIRSLHVLAPAPVEAGPATAAIQSVPEPTAPAAPMQRAGPPAGYRDAIAAHRATWTTTRQHSNPKIQKAAERQLREPEENFADGRQALEELCTKVAAERAGAPQRGIAGTGPATPRR